MADPNPTTIFCPERRSPSPLPTVWSSGKPLFSTVGSAIHILVVKYFLPQCAQSTVGRLFHSILSTMRTTADICVFGKPVRASFGHRGGLFYRRTKNSSVYGVLVTRGNQNLSKTGCQHQVNIRRRRKRNTAAQECIARYKRQLTFNAKGAHVPALYPVD